MNELELERVATRATAATRAEAECRAKPYLIACHPCPVRVEVPSMVSLGALQVPHRCEEFQMSGPM